MSNKIKVMVVDDSAIGREGLKSILSEEDIEVVSTAADPILAFTRIENAIPDVIITDIEMPNMDGIAFLKELKTRGYHIPVIVCSSVVEKGSDKFLASLEHGAVEVVLKPKLGSKAFFEESKILMCDAVRAAYHSNKHNLKASIDSISDNKVVNTVPADKTYDKIVVLGASTGGTHAIEALLSDLPANCPPIVIVQHMPEFFTLQFANRLNLTYAMEVREAQNMDEVKAGLVLIAPGNKHTLITEIDGKYFTEVKDGPLVTRHRPSVDVLFRSAAMRLGSKAVGVILTGMGDDGAIGMKEMKDSGSYNIAQDKETSVVFGMPAEAIKAGAVDLILPLKEIAKELLQRT